MPYCASFRAGRFDFVVAIAHIYYGKTKAERNQRREEIQQLVDFINRRTKTAQGKVFDRDLFCRRSEHRGGRRPIFRCTGLARFRHARRHEFPKNQFQPDQDIRQNRLGNRSQFSPTGAHNVVLFYKTVFQDKTPKLGQAEISDHLPVWAEFKINSLTQELDQILNPGG